MNKRLKASLIAGIGAGIIGFGLTFLITHGTILNLAKERPVECVFALFWISLYGGGVVALTWKD